MKIRTRIFIYLLIIFTLIIAHTVLHKWTLNSVGIYKEREHNAHRQLVALYNIKTEVSKYMEEMGDHLYTNDDAAINQRFAIEVPLENLRRATYHENLLLGAKLSNAENNEVELINAIQSILIVMERKLASILENNKTGNNQGAEKIYTELSEELFKKKFITLVDQGIKDEQKEINKHHEIYQQVAQKGEKLTVTISLLTTLIIIVVSWYFLRDILISFNKISIGTDRLVNGEYQEKIVIDGDNEFTEMAETLNSLGENIQDKIDTMSVISEAHRMAKEDAESSRQAMSEFLANMSHEVRTPLNGIIGLTDLILKMDIKDERQLQYIKMVKDSGNRLLRIINDILDFSRIDARRLDLESINFSFRETISSALAPLEGLAQQKGLSFSHTFAEDIPEHMIGDPVRLTQVLINLVNNAIKFTEKGQIDITIDVANRVESNLVLHFEVHDTGIGVPAEIKDKIFQAFTQAEPSFARHYGGSGLGLAIASELTRLMGGRIWIESGSLPNRRLEDTNMGEHPGSSFHFTAALETLPEKINAPQKRPAPSAIKESLPENLHILLVDDEPINRMLTSEILALEGWQVSEAEEGNQALKMMEESDFDVVLMDIEMPGLDGPEVTRRYRTIEAGTGKHVPIIAMTAHAIEGLKERCLRAGMDGYVSKPFEVEELFEIIAINLPQIPLSNS